MEEESALDIDEATLSTRIILIKDQLINISKSLRGAIPTTLGDDALIEDDNFKHWMLSNLIIEGMENDSNNEDFNRFLYFMFEQVGGNVARLIDQYELEINNIPGGTYSFNLIIKEPEQKDE